MQADEVEHHDAAGSEALEGETHTRAHPANPTYPPPPTADSAQNAMPHEHPYEDETHDVATSETPRHGARTGTYTTAASSNPLPGSTSTQNAMPNGLEASAGENNNSISGNTSQPVSNGYHDGPPGMQPLNTTNGVDHYTSAGQDDIIQRIQPAEFEESPLGRYTTAYSRWDHFAVLGIQPPGFQY